LFIFQRRATPPGVKSKSACCSLFGKLRFGCDLAVACLICQLWVTQSSSPHPFPAVPLAAACIRSQLQLSTCPAPHTSPEGLRLHSIAAPPPPEHTQQSAFAPSCSIRIGLHSQSDEAQHLPCTALQPWRASFVQQVLSPARARQHAASAAGCLLCRKAAAAFAALHFHVPHTSPEGLRWHSIAAPPDARALPAVRIRAQLFNSHRPAFAVR